MFQIITIANMKGGVGKTTTAVSLAAGLAMSGRKTILIDLDAHCSAALNFFDQMVVEKSPTIADIIKGSVTLQQALIPTHIRFLSVILPADTQARLINMGDFTRCEKNIFRTAFENYSTGELILVVIDTPPNIDELTIQAISASDWIIVPVTCEYLPLLGLKKFNQVLKIIKDTAGGSPKILGYLLTMVDRRERITWEVEEILRRTFGNQLFSTQIRIDTKVKVCPSHRQTIYEYEGKDGRARNDYEMLVKEVLQRLEI